MLTLLMMAGGMGIASATAALWMQGRRMVYQRVFAALVHHRDGSPVFGHRLGRGYPDGQRTCPRTLALGRRARLAVRIAPVPRIAHSTSN
jgi:hypothetical protein